MKPARDWTKIGLYAATALVALLLGASLSILIYGLDGPENGRSAGLLEGSSFAPPDASGQAPIGGPFTLVDEDGETRTEEVLEGRYSLVYFGFTQCPDFCPRELGNLAAAKAQIEAAGLSPQILFITIDPERDRPEMLKDFVDYFDPDILGLGGSAEQVAVAARGYRVFYQRREDEDSPGDYLMDHSLFVYLMGPDGEFIAHFSALTDPSEIAARVLAAREQGA